MPTKLYPHQEKFLKDPNNSNSILCYETGCGKSFVSKLWLQQKDRAKNALILCPKQIRGTWKKDAPYATVYSFEDFKKYPSPVSPTAIVVDEADMVASPLFVAKQRSQRTEKLYAYIMQNPQAHILLLTATPVRSTPWNIHTLLVLARLKPPQSWKEFRELYFELRYMPYLPRPAWMPKQGWQKMMQPIINKYTHTALMADMVDLPEETHEVIKLKAPEYEKNDEWEPMAQFVADHRLEQRTKSAEIKKIAKGYRKVVIVAHYTEQIDELNKELSKERLTHVLDGRTPDAEQVIAEAEASSECYLIIQASVGAGFELPSFAVMIFASQGYSVRNWTQMIGRIKRINSLKPTKFYYLIGGRCDNMIYESIKAGKDFVPSQYLRAS